MRVGEMRVVEMRVGKMRVGEMRVGKVRVGKMRVGEMRVVEMRVGKMRVGEMSPNHEQELSNCYSEMEFSLVYPSSVKSHLENVPLWILTYPCLVLDNCISQFEVTTLTTMDSQSPPAVTRIII